jgi:hypothetical protein
MWERVLDARGLEFVERRSGEVLDQLGRFGILGIEAAYRAYLPAYLEACLATEEPYDEYGADLRGYLLSTLKHWPAVPRSGWRRGAAAIDGGGSVRPDHIEYEPL